MMEKTQGFGWPPPHPGQLVQQRQLCGFATSPTHAEAPTARKDWPSVELLALPLVSWQLQVRDRVHSQGGGRWGAGSSVFYCSGSNHMHLRATSPSLRSALFYRTAPYEIDSTLLVYINSKTTKHIPGLLFVRNDNPSCLVDQAAVSRR